ncbi:MAG: DNA gyrase subunit A [Candidatus Ryanbacteria bacterium RIFCSPLOWO2_02_FULL_47_14]|uniref:DNA gyrase subunit A n=1 Tax=Candidatus Ryanbacteria bacterium RIFCSPLOWO2_02_FULL_47_14 TaxID=1802129 RepID=A0A1G2H3I3_9BACT|nr:MAG: DNA gyrase subunit A [Candidatus Ryanbacteria bacterium RIFCSPLOWO2_02_FULL_47_14]
MKNDDAQELNRRNISTEMREAYLSYAMSVIVARALPDVRDGLKPVQRRIIYTMKELGFRSSSKYVKSARVVGEVLGKYHPHGDTAVYDALARMAQTFSLRYPLIDGQGNFGSIDGDPPAAMRYTEARLTRISDELLSDIDKETVDFIPTYDGSREEPTVLPARIPNLLLNGSLGIAVGMATSIPPHNLRELIDATIAVIDKPKATLEELMNHVQGPDFPTGGIIFNRQDIAQAYATGRGGVVMRGEVDITEKGKSYSIMITSLPFQVNKAELIEKIAELVREKKIEGIRDIRDESDKSGLTIAIDLKNDAYPQKILNALYKHTDLEKVFHFNMLALSGGIQPQTLSLKSYLEEFIGTRTTMVERRTRHELRIAEDRAHILEGLKKALDHIDEIISTIKKSKDRETAHENLTKKFHLSDKQATAILEMRLATLSGLERKKIEDELAHTIALIKELKAILADPKRIRDVIKKELSDIREKYGDERRTRVIPTGTTTIAVEDMIPEEEHIVLMTRDGYLKRLKPKEFRAQKRGGKGIVGGEWKEEDVVLNFATCGTHDTLLFFSTTGKVYETKTYEIPEASRIAKGKPIVNFLALAPSEEITSFIAVPKKKKGKDAFLVMATKHGIIKKTDLHAFLGVRRSGIIAMKLRKGDVLGWVRIAEKGDDCMLFTKRGQAIRFTETKIRTMGRQAQGVRGIKLASGDEVIGCDTVSKGNADLFVFSISAAGYGKKTMVKEFKTQSRGGSGVKTMSINEKTKPLVAVKILDNTNEQYIAISQKGKTLRSYIKELPTLGRATQGVRIMRLEGQDRLSAVAVL